MARTRKRRNRSARSRPRATPRFDGVRLTKTGTEARMLAALEAQHRLQFVVKWTKSRQLVLTSLQIKVPPQNLWDELLDHPLGDNSGEIVVEMGMYSAGPVTIRFTIGALTAIPRAATFVVEDEQKVSRFKPPAHEDPKTLTQGEQWSDNGKYTIGASA